MHEFMSIPSCYCARTPKATCTPDGHLCNALLPDTPTFIGSTMPPETHIIDHTPRPCTRIAPNNMYSITPTCITDMHH
jgi:hypothetical protein